MKFSVNKSEMVTAVSNIQGAVSTKTTIPALEGVLITAGANTLELRAYNLEHGITTSIPASVSEEGQIVLNAKMFFEIVRNAPEEIISVDVDEKNIVMVRSGKSRHNFIGIAAVEFPELPKISDYTSLQIPANVLKSMIRQTIFAVAESDAHPVHQGSLFNIEDGVLDVVSVDGYRLTKRSEPIDFNENISFVVPGKTLNEILKLLPDNDEPVEISAGRRYILFKIENYEVVSSLLEGEFLNYKVAIPAEHKTEVTLRTREVIDSVNRSAVFIKDRLKSPLRCIFEDGGIKLSCMTALGRWEDEISADIDGDSVEIGFNSRYLLDALRNTECDEIKAQLSGPLSPMKIVPNEGDSFLFLVLPVRLKND